MLDPSQSSVIPDAIAASMQDKTRVRCPECGAVFPGPPRHASEANGQSPLGYPLSHITRRDVTTLSSSAGLAALPAKFAETGADYVILVDHENRPLGVASAAALFRNVAEHGRTSLTEMPALDAAAGGALYMRESTNISAALERLLSDEKARCIVVVGEDERLVGIVTHREALQLFSRELSVEAPTMPG